MKKMRVLLLVCVFVFSFTLNGFATEQATIEPEVESQLTIEPQKHTERVIDYEVTTYTSDGRGGYMRGGTKVYYKDITFENGYEMTGVQREKRGVRDGSCYFLISRYNYITY